MQMKSFGFPVAARCFPFGVEGVHLVSCRLGRKGQEVQMQTHMHDSRREVEETHDYPQGLVLQEGLHAN